MAIIKIVVVKETENAYLIVVVEERRATVKAVLLNAASAASADFVVAIVPVSEEFRAHFKVTFVDE
jgi:hypothetical protein